MFSGISLYSFIRKHLPLVLNKVKSCKKNNPALLALLNKTEAQQIFDYEENIFNPRPVNHYRGGSRIPRGRGR